MKLLLTTGKVDVDGRDDLNITPFSHAAGNGHDRVVSLLLTTGRVDIDAKDYFNITPL